jgi:hypothetical protein
LPCLDLFDFVLLKQEEKDQNRKELANTSNLPHNNNKNYTREKDNQSVTENINKRKQQSSNENGNKTIKRMLSYPEHKINVDASPVKKQKSTDQKIDEVAQNQTNLHIMTSLDRRLLCFLSLTTQ